jgi:uncharacterized protein (TIGR03663 family)
MMELSPALGPASSSTLVQPSPSIGEPLHAPSPSQWFYAGWEGRVQAALVVTGLLLRLVLLGDKPLHFDEGVNGSFVDRMVAEGFYHYDPNNYHGPLHFYALFLSQTLFGRHVWALRLPGVLASAASVALTFGFRPLLGRNATLLAAAAMALSPALVFYGRDAIHESWMELFLMLTFWGMAGLYSTSKKCHLWGTGLGICGMLLTKETYLLHVCAIALAFPTLHVLERFSPSRNLEPAPQQRQWTYRDFLKVSGCFTALLIFFYSGCFLDWPGLEGLWKALAAWTTTGTGGESGHEKPWHYWLELLLRYEWPAFLGLIASGIVVRRGIHRHVRYLAIYGAGTLAAYSLVPYKTPWCIVSMLWPWALLFGAASCSLAKHLDRWVALGTASVVLAHSLAMSLLLNFRTPTDEEEPYVYVQTLPEIAELIAPLRQVTREDPRKLHGAGYVLLPELFPWSWLLGQHSRVTYLNPPEFPEEIETPEFVLADPSLLEKLEATLTEPYFKHSIRVRGNSGEETWLYLRASTFAHLFPDRTPEFPEAQEVAGEDENIPSPPADRADPVNKNAPPTPPPPK